MESAKLMVCLSCGKKEWSTFIESNTCPCCETWGNLSPIEQENF